MYCSRCGTEVAESSKFCPSCGLDLGVQTPLGRVSAAYGAEKTELSLVQEALQDEYEIIKELGRGGMAIVFRARDKHLEREVAVKVLPFSLAFDAEFVERFQREARTAARLEHPNIIPIYRVGKSGRVIYFVMKFLRGKALSETLEQRGALPPDEIRELLIQTAGALGYAHKHEIVHRDIKPDNIMFDELGHAVVTDFGIAKAASGTRLTGTGMSIGTPHYMSPEQARAQPLDGRSDIYSLGVVAYQCLTGRVPFDGDDAFSIGYKHIMEELTEPPLPSAAHRELFGIVRRMMAKSRDERLQNAEELVEVLKGRPSQERVAAELESAPTVAIRAVDSVQATRPGGQTPRPSTPTTPMPRTPVPPRPTVKKKGRGGLLAASLVVLLGGGGVGGYYYYQNYYLPGLGLPDLEPLAVADSTPGDSAGLVLLDTAAVVDSSAPSDTAAADTLAGPVLADSGWLTVAGAPQGARYFLDGRVQRGETMRLGIGSYRLEVRASGFRDHSVMVTIGRGDSLVQPVSLERAPAPEEPATEIADRPADTAVPPARPAPRAQCTSPTQANYNLNGACYDALPRLLGDPRVPLTPAVGPSPSPVTVWVQVGTDGRPLQRAPAQQSNDAQFTLLALQYAMNQSYQPAQKNGRPVQAWFQVRLFPGSR